MKRIVVLWLVSCCILTGMSPAPAVYGAGLLPAQLRCEHRVDPLGIDRTKPRLSWIVTSEKRSQTQSAYEILVATEPGRLKPDHADLWASGKVASDNTIDVTYAGRPLVSNQRCYWKMRVWDQDGRVSKWSQTACWTMGLLRQEDWKGQWIGHDQARARHLQDAPFEDAFWIWHGNDPVENVRPGKHALLAKFSLPAAIQVESASLFVAGDDAYSVFLNEFRAVNTQVADGNHSRQAREREVKAHVRPGKNILRATIENATNGAAGFIAKLVVKSSDGKVFSLATDASWLSSEKPSSMPTDQAAWSPCRVLGQYGIAPWGKIKSAGIETYPAVYLRTEFPIKDGITRATLYASALGWADTYLNGKRLTEERFNPGWTDYNKRVYYRAYDVTAHLHKGKNVWGASLADGWFSGYIGWYGERDHYGTDPRYSGQIVIDYADGSTETVATGRDWRCSTGPICQADILMGESYDARKEIEGWDQPGFNAGNWLAVTSGTKVQPQVQAHPGEPVRVVREFVPKQITQPKPNVYVFDLDQNIAGVARLAIRGKPGQQITLRFAERLNPDGTIFTENLRLARATDTYVCKANRREIWEPRFTFHGFQYIEVTGLTEKPDRTMVTGLALSSDTPQAGQFACSDPMITQLYKNIYWTQRANFIDIPTDCPQRDERLGWTGDAQVYVRAATLNTDVQAFFEKWLRDLRDAQREDGQFPKVAPCRVSNNDGGPAWADAGVICPWTIYETYGDLELLAENYPAMCRFVDFCVQRSTSELLPPKKFHCYGDWLNIDAPTPPTVIYSAFFAHSAHLTAKAAQALGKEQDAAKYNALFSRLKKAFRKAYIKADGRIEGDTQTCYVLALAFELVDGKQAQQAREHLLETLEKCNWHLSTGFIGTKDLMLVLSQIGRNDVACRLLHNETFPSWGFSVKNGARSIWERWNAWTPEKGFADSTMNSFAHYSFGAVYQWMVENLGGIRNDDSAYKKIVIAPYFDEKLDWARVSYNSVRGPITSEWRRDGGMVQMEICIPANATALLKLPIHSVTSVKESGKALDKSDSIRVINQNPEEITLAVGSGRYRFTLNR